MGCQASWSRVRTFASVWRQPLLKLWIQLCCPKWFEEPVEYSSLWWQYPPFIFWFFDPSQVYILFPVWRATEMAIRRRIHRGKECSSLTKNSPNPSITYVYHPSISTATTVAVASVPKFQQKEFAFFCISSSMCDFLDNKWNHIRSSMKHPGHQCGTSNAQCLLLTYWEILVGFMRYAIDMLHYVVIHLYHTYN